MSRINNVLGSYTDVKRVFDAALERGVVEYELQSWVKAHAWRARAYTYRTKLLEQSAKQLAGTNIAPSTPYDTIFIQLSKGSKVLTIHRERPGGILRDASGQIIEREEITPVRIDASTDPFLEEAERLAREAGIEI